MGHFKQAISKGAFPMINMGYNTEISDVFHAGKGNLSDKYRQFMVAVRYSLFAIRIPYSPLTKFILK